MSLVKVLLSKFWFRASLVAALCLYFINFVLFLTLVVVGLEGLAFDVVFYLCLGPLLLVGFSVAFGIFFYLFREIMIPFVFHGIPTEEVNEETK